MYAHPRGVDGRGQQADEGDGGLQPEATSARPERLDKHTDDGHADHDHHRRQQRIFQIRRGDRRVRLQVHEVHQPSRHQPCPPRSVCPLSDEAVSACTVRGDGSVCIIGDMAESIAGLSMFNSGCGKNPNPTISTTAGASAVSCVPLSSTTPRLSSRRGPVIMRWNIHKMYRAANMIVMVARTPKMIETLNVPTSTMNSETNGARPGSDKLDKPASRKIPAAIGAARDAP